MLETRLYNRVVWTQLKIRLSNRMLKIWSFDRMKNRLGNRMKNDLIIVWIIVMCNRISRFFEIFRDLFKKELIINAKQV